MKMLTVNSILILTAFCSFAFGAPPAQPESKALFTAQATILYEDASLKYPNTVDGCYKLGKAIGEASALARSLSSTAQTWTDVSENQKGHIKELTIELKAFDSVDSCQDAHSAQKNLSRLAGSLQTLLLQLQ